MTTKRALFLLPADSAMGSQVSSGQPVQIVLVFFAALDVVGLFCVRLGALMAMSASVAL